MGLLDDAIRDHLELKRRRGGDPADIERMEREALGPVRRVQETADPMLETSQPAVAYEPEPYADAGRPTAPAAEDWEYEEEEALLPGESWEHGEPAAAGSPPPDFEYDEHEPPTEFVPPPAREPAHEAPADVLPPAAAAPPPAVAPPAPEPDVDGETVEYDIEAEDAGAEAHPAQAEFEHDPAAREPAYRDPEPQAGVREHDHEDEGPEHAGDDVLEETPEFFQDAPEHDRLWFEQRPPKDFDFDG
jgi:hypothetical protein